MRENKRGFEGTGFERRRQRPDVKLRDEQISTEALEERAVRAFAKATRQAASRAHAAGLSIPGRVKGKRVLVAPDGSVTEVAEGQKS